jgi:hypothetical protein
MVDRRMIAHPFTLGELGNVVTVGRRWSSLVASADL